jgi:hypothetical protein
MNTTLYSNLPNDNATNSGVVQAYDVYFGSPLELDTGTLAAMKGFFGGRGFDEISAGSISIIIMNQAKKDGYNPMKILDTLEGVDNVAISNLVSEILNYNRFKSSFLGYTDAFVPQFEVLRNILA